MNIRSKIDIIEKDIEKMKEKCLINFRRKHDSLKLQAGKSVEYDLVYAAIFGNCRVV